PIAAGHASYRVHSITIQSPVPITRARTEPSLHATVMLHIPPRASARKMGSASAEADSRSATEQHANPSVATPAAAGRAINSPISRTAHKLNAIAARFAVEHPSAT